MVQQNQFVGHLTEDPNEHIGKFLRMANTVKLNGVRPEVIKLHLFPFSLRDIAATWYESLSYGSVNTWEELVEAYLGRFFPPSLTTERRREIIVFKQGEDESLYMLTGSEYIHKFITLLPKDYCLIPSNNANYLYIVFYSYCIH